MRPQTTSKLNITDSYIASIDSLGDREVFFIITAVQFGVTDAMHGLATMLKLIWVQDMNIKSAVVQAFRQLYLYSDDTGECR